MTSNEIEKLKWIAAVTARGEHPERARCFAEGMAREAFIHRISEEMRAVLKIIYPASRFSVSSGTYEGFKPPKPPRIVVAWADGPSLVVLLKMMDVLISKYRSEGFVFDTRYAHLFTCATCGKSHEATPTDEPPACTDGGNA
jgi:hypothetical protein